MTNTKVSICLFSGYGVKNLQYIRLPIAFSKKTLKAHLVPSK